MHTLIFFIGTSMLSGANGALYHPDVQTYLLEHILVDNWGAYASNFSSAITPCTNYVTQTGTAALNSGRTTAAQWIRVLFHDFVTANVTAGTGGVDASIGFETARSENSGSAFNDSFTFWRPFVNDAVSMADLVSLGTAMSNNLCGSRILPFRAGRIDATSAGSTTGVPAPETALDETLTFFERAGFDKVDAIGLTACGHTMGSVHHGGFPAVVDATAVTPTNTNGGSNFDTTRGVFDTNVVSEYVHWTGSKGGPLVTSFNISSRSDLRLYESDQNATMRALLAQGDSFLDTCVDLLGRAMDTVPLGVQLGAPIDAMVVKPINVTFDFDSARKLKLSGNIRLLTAAGSLPPSSMTIHISNYSDELTSEDTTGSSVFGRSETNYGTSTYFPFSISGAHNQKATSFSVTTSSVTTSFDISSEIFIVPSLTTMSNSTINVTVAVLPIRTCDSISTQVAVPVSQQGTLAPRIGRANIASLQSAGIVGAYTLCSGSVTLEGIPTGLVTLEATAEGQHLDTYLLNGGAAGW